MSGRGGGGGGGLSKLGIALTLIFAITLVAIVGQFLYFLCRRRRVFRRQISSDRVSLYSSSDSSTFSSKELLYFFCIRPQSRIESSSATVPRPVADISANRQLDIEGGVDVDVFKLQGMVGPPRFLFTIKEEEREGLESPADKSLHAADRFGKRIGDLSRSSAGSLEECFRAADDVATTAMVLEMDGVDVTPFSTPCASPSYFTPAASPVHEAAGGRRTAIGERKTSGEVMRNDAVCEVTVRT